MINKLSVDKQKYYMDYNFRSEEKKQNTFFYLLNTG